MRRDLQIMEILLLGNLSNARRDVKLQIDTLGADAEPVRETGGPPESRFTGQLQLGVVAGGEAGLYSLDASFAGPVQNGRQQFMSLIQVLGPDQEVETPHVRLEGSGFGKQRGQPHDALPARLQHLHRSPGPLRPEHERGEDGKIPEFLQGGMDDEAFLVVLDEPGMGSGVQGRDP